MANAAERNKGGIKANNSKAGRTKEIKQADRQTKKKPATNQSKRTSSATKQNEKKEKYTVVMKPGVLQELDKSRDGDGVVMRPGPIQGNTNELLHVMILLFVSFAGRLRGHVSSSQWSRKFDEEATHAALDAHTCYRKLVQEEGECKNTYTNIAGSNLFRGILELLLANGDLTPLKMAARVNDIKSFYHYGYGKASPLYL
jgi:hypothetical protein